MGVVHPPFPVTTSVVPRRDSTRYLYTPAADTVTSRTARGRFKPLRELHYMWWDIVLPCGRGAGAARAGRDPDRTAPGAAPSASPTSALRFAIVNWSLRVNVSWCLATRVSTSHLETTARARPGLRSVGLRYHHFLLLRRGRTRIREAAAFTTAPGARGCRRRLGRGGKLPLTTADRARVLVVQPRRDAHQVKVV